MRHTAGPRPTDLGELADLQAFSLIVDLGSITAAARVLKETKGAVSRRLARLEARLGVALVQRSPRFVRTTPEGEAFRQRLRPAFDLLEEAHTEVRQTGQAPKGHLRVTAPPDIGTLILAPLLARFGSLFPQVSIDFLLTDETLDFDAGRIDVAFRVQAALRDSSLSAHKLMSLEIAAYASPAYLCTHAPPLKPIDLAQHRVSSFHVAPRRPIFTSSTQSGSFDSHAGEPAFRANDGAFLRQIALGGGGVVFVPRVFAEEDVKTGQLVPVLQDFETQPVALFLMHAPKRVLPPRTRAFVDFVTDSLSPKIEAKSRTKRGSR